MKKYNTINTKKIENFRKENKLTKKEFCSLCKISLNTYNKILNGKNVLITSIFKISILMKIHICELFKD